MSSQRSSNRLAFAFFFMNTDSHPTQKHTPLRSEIAIEDTWDLSAIYADDEAWESAFINLKETYPQIAKFRGRVGRSAADLSAALEFECELEMAIERLHHYASLRKSEDSSNNANLDRSGRIMNLLTLVSEACSFLTPEIMAIPDSKWKKFVAHDELSDWRGYLERVRRFKPHTLDAAGERLMALSGSALGSTSHVFSQLTNVDMRFGELADEYGIVRDLTQSSLSTFLESRSPEVRCKAFHQFYQEVSDHKFTLAAALAGSVRSDVFQARARNYSSAIQAALFPDRVPIEVYDTLVTTVRSRLDLLHHYYEVRRRALGLDEIHHYDTFVPIVSEIRKHTTWDEAVDIIEAALQPLGTEYTSTLVAGLKGRWADRYETKGKRSGAFSSSSYGNPPYILMNYKADVFADIYTLAHEGGHSMHTWFSQNHQLYQDYQYPIFTAEVASTFNEELLTHHLLATADDPKLRLYIINRQIDDLRGTLFRQTMFAEFERLIHDAEEAGESLTLDAFRSIYRSLLDAYFGKNFAIDTELELECLRIPHFYSAFYVYKYATGISAAVSLARRVLHGGQQELDDYLGFLKSGGSRYPLETLLAAGVDMTSPKPIQDALDLFAARVTELESGLAELGR